MIRFAGPDPSGVVTPLSDDQRDAEGGCDGRVCDVPLIHRSAWADRRRAFVAAVVGVGDGFGVAAACKVVVGCGEVRG